ncbi:TPA: mandelate racemase/muconate lactonizing enzyme family protein [Methanopyrus kandleri]|nr:mandelate racemase/muconate lactonizing enzyme family protein [Methanopyrus kandleri]HII69678.1 mandelate racemase/muconate lactonizing enzyme family protein [Methanopyrus kandleri]
MRPVETRRVTLNGAAGRVDGYVCRVYSSEGHYGTGFGFDPAVAHEMAVMDAEARSQGLPLAELLGGEPRTVESACSVHELGKHGALREARDNLSVGYTVVRVRADSAGLSSVSALDFETVLLEFTDRPSERALEEVRSVSDAEIVVISPEEFDAEVPIYVRVTSEEDIHGLGSAEGVALSVQEVGFLDAVLLGRKARELGFKIIVLTEVESAVSVKAAAHLAGALRAEYCDLSGHLALYEDLESLGYAPEVELTGPGREVRVNHDPYELAEAP